MISANATRILLAAHLAVILGCSQVLLSQDWTYRFDGAPILISELGTRTYTLRNATKRVVRAYTLGCVKTPLKRDREVVMRLKTQVVNLKPGEEIRVVGVDGLPEHAECFNRSTKLAVTDAEYDDGTTWHWRTPN